MSQVYLSQFARRAGIADTASYVIGGGTPAPEDTYIQFNKGNKFGADQYFRYIYPIHSFQHGNGTNALGVYSHAEGTFTFTGFTNTYSSSILSSSVTLSAAYGNITSSFKIGDYLYINDSEFDNIYGTVITTINNITWDDTSSYLNLDIPDIHITKSFVGNFNNYYIQNSLGDQIARAYVAHAEGRDTYAAGIGAHTEGSGSYAIGHYSHTEGNNTVALGDYQTVVGQYNIFSTSQSAFIIGDGYTEVLTSGTFGNSPTSGSSSFYINSTYSPYTSLTGSIITVVSASSSIGETFIIEDINNLGGGEYEVVVNRNTTQNYYEDIDTYSIMRVTRHNLLFASQSWFQISASNVYLQGIPDSSSVKVLMYDNITGKVTYTASSTFGGPGSTPNGPDTSIQFNNSGDFDGSENFLFNYNTNVVTLTGSMIVSGAISSSYGVNTVGFYGTSSWAISASQASTASFITASNVWGPFGSSSVASASYASSSTSASYAATASFASSSPNFANANLVFTDDRNHSTNGYHYFLYSNLLGGGGTSPFDGFAVSGGFYFFDNDSNALGVAANSTNTYTYIEITSQSIDLSFTADPAVPSTYIFTNTSASFSSSLNVTKSVYFPGLTPASQPYVVVIDTASGQLYYTSSFGGTATFSGNNTQVVFYSGSTSISGSPNFTFNYTVPHLQITGSTTLSGSTFIPGINNTAQQNVVTIDPTTGQLFYTSSNALSAVSTPLDIRDEGIFIKSSPTFLNFTGSGVSASVSGAGVNVFIPGGGAGIPGGSNTQLQFNSSSTFSGSSNLTFNYINNGLTLTGSMFVSGAISASFGSNTIGFFGTSSWAVSASRALTSVSASYASSSTSASYAATASAAPFDTYIQYNKNGLFGASQYFRYIYSSQSLQQGFNTETVGLYSHTEGLNTLALSNYSHAEGINTRASGDYSHTEGFQTTASGQASHAEGYLTTASGVYSHTEGQQTTASGQASHTEGRLTTALGDWSHAEGYQTISSGDYSHVEGRQTIALGQASHAEGYLTLASNSYSHAEGWLTTASGLYSHTEGQGTKTSGAYSHAEGYQTIAEGLGSHTEGYQNISLGPYSHAEGYRTTSSGQYSHAEGRLTTALGDWSHAEGSSTIALGQHSHAEGYLTITSGSYSHTEGQGTKASGSYSHAEGYYTSTVGFASHAEGINTIASGGYSHAEGKDTIALGDYSHAEGIDTLALGTNSHTEGRFTTSSGNAAHAEGSFSAAGFRGFFAYLDSTNDVIEIRGQGDLTSLFTSNEIVVSANGLYTYTSTLWSDPTFSLAMTDDFNLGGTAYVADINNLFVISGVGNGDSAHAEGTATQAVNNFAHAEGNSTAAYGAASHTEGYQTKTLKAYSHAEGYQTTASGQGAHAEGRQTLALTDYSHTAGFFTTSSASYQSIVGQYNVTSTSQSAFIVGGGSNSATRKNLLFVGSNIFEASASTILLKGLTNTSQTNVLTYNPVTNQVYYTASSTLSGTSIPLDIRDEGTSISSNPTFLNFTGSGVTATVNGAGVNIFIPGGGAGSGDITDVIGGAGITVDNSGGPQPTASLNTSSVHFINGVSQLTGSLLTTSSFNSWTGSNTSEFAGTASFASRAVSSSYPINVLGSTLYSVDPVSGVPSLNNLTGSIFFGGGSGYIALNASQSNFLGANAGYNAQNANNSNFLGAGAGYSAQNANNSNFLGQNAGYLATNADNSLFIGNSAGLLATNAKSSNFIGAYAGGTATNASQSNFLGYQTGYGAISASTSTLIGYQVGYAPTVDLSVGPNNIIIGTNITLSPQRKNSINIGGIIFGTGSYATTSGVPVSSSAGGNIGINIPIPTYNFHVSGTVAFPNLTDSNTATKVVLLDNNGQLFTTASNAIGGGGSGVTINNNTNNYLVTATGTANTLDGEANLTFDGSSLKVIGNVTASSFTGSFTGSLLGTASYVTTLNQELTISGNIIPAGPYVDNTSSYNLGSPTAAWDKIYVSNNSLHFVSGSTSSSIGFNNGVISFNDATVNIPTGSIVPTASLAYTASYVTGSIFTNANPALSASFALTASFALNAGSTFNSTSSIIGNGSAASFNINHGFNTRNIHITVYESSSNGETVYPDIRRINENTASVIFANPPSVDQYIVYISQ